LEKLIDLAKFGVGPALIQDNASIVTYLDLNLEVQEISEKIRGTSLIFLLGSNTVQSICVYLAALAVKVPIVLLPNTMNSTKLASLVETYKPSWIFAGDRKEVDSYDSKLSQLISTISFLSLEKTSFTKLIQTFGYYSQHQDQPGVLS